MKRLSAYFESERGKRIKNLIIGVGASIVLLGALFKLEHWEGASTMLIIGMCTEAFIFALLGILPPHKDYYWEKIYPELNIAPDEDELEMLQEKAAHQQRPSLTNELDKMMEQAQLEPALIQRLGDNLKRLGDNISQLRDLTDASHATNEYSEKAKQAASALAEMKVAYSNATDAARMLSQASEETKHYHEQVQIVSKNLAQLNAIYELELQDTNSHLKTMNKFYGSLAQAMDNLNDSVEDTQKYKNEISGLAKNLTALNSIYGNMLTAMTMNSGRGNG